MLNDQILFELTCGENSQTPVKDTQFGYIIDIYFNYKLVIFIFFSDRNLTFIGYRCGINGIKTITYQNICAAREGCEAGVVKLRIKII